VRHHAFQAVSLFRGYRLSSESKAEASIRLKSEGFLPQWDSKLDGVIAGLKDMAMASESIEWCGCHLGIADHTGPFAEA
jgi:hypothetical protein